MLKTHNDTTVDEKEMKHFEKYADQWWDKNGKYNVLHEINPLRLKYIKDAIISHFSLLDGLKPFECKNKTIHTYSKDERYQDTNYDQYDQLEINSLNESKEQNNASNDRNEERNDDDSNTLPPPSTPPISLTRIKILDVGCGGGLLSLPLANLGANVLGIDSNASNIEAAICYASKYKIQNLDYQHSSIEDLVKRIKNCNINDDYSDDVNRDLENESDGMKVIIDEAKKYDVIVAFEVLEHVANLDLFISSCIELLRDGGLILFSTINRNLKAYILAILAAENVLGWIPKGTHSYNKLIQPSEIESLLRKHQFKIAHMSGLTCKFKGLWPKFQNPCKLQWEISDDISVNYMMKIHAI